MMINPTLGFRKGQLLIQISYGPHSLSVLTVNRIPQSCQLRFVSLFRRFKLQKIKTENRYETSLSDSHIQHLREMPQSVHSAVDVPWLVTIGLTELTYKCAASDIRHHLLHLVRDDISKIDEFANFPRLPPR